MELSDLPLVQEFFPIINGVASHLQYDFKDIIQKERVDLLFNLNYGMKTIAPGLARYCEGTKATDSQLAEIASLMQAIYSKKWDRYISLYNIDYDPIHNYKDELTETIENTGTETGNTTNTGSIDSTNNTTKDDTRTDNVTETKNLSTSDTSTVTRTDNLTKTTTGTDTRTDNLSSKTSGTTKTVGSNSSADNIFGFNSSTAVPSETSSGNDTTTVTVDQTVVDTGTQKNDVSESVQNKGTQTNATEGNVTNTGTVANTGTIKNEGSTQAILSSSTENTEIFENSINGTKTRTATHAGNIGNISTQKLIKEDIELWKWNFTQSLLEDLNEFLTCPMYS